MTSLASFLPSTIFYLAQCKSNDDCEEGKFCNVLSLLLGAVTNGYCVPCHVFGTAQEYHIDCDSNTNILPFSEGKINCKAECFGKFIFISTKMFDRHFISKHGPNVLC